MEYKENLFRFLVLRPVETGPDDTAARKILTLGNGGQPVTAFQTKVSRAASREEAADIAREAMGLGPYRKFADGPVIDELARIRDKAALMEPDADPAGLGDLFEQPSDELRALLRGAAASKLEAMLWDVVIASSLVPTRDRHLHGQVVDAIRAVALFQSQKDISSVAEIHTICRASLALPAWTTGKPHRIATPPTPPADSEDEGSAPPSISDKGRKLADINRLAGNLDKLRMTGALSPKLAPGAVGGPAGTRGGSGRTAVGVMKAGRLESALDAASVKLLDETAPNWRELEDGQVDSVLAINISAMTKDLSLADKFLANPSPYLHGPGSQTGSPGGAPTPTVPDAFDNHIDEGLGRVKPAGYGDLMLTRHTLLGYRQSEIAYVENVLQGELRERVHRRMLRNEEFYSTETEDTSETTRDLTTEDRYSVGRESANEIWSQTDASLGISITGYGPMVEATSTAGLSSSTVRSDSRSTSTNYAKNIISNTVDRIAHRVTERAERRRIAETEETNTHKLQGNDQGGHTVGIYCWLEKQYSAQVWNYGKRLMMEFVIPEPAAFFRHAKSTNVHAGAESGSLPELPDNFTFTSINRSNYRTLTAPFHLADLRQPPTTFTRVTEVMKVSNPSGGAMVHDKLAIELPEGYKARSLEVSGVWDHMPDKATVSGEDASGDRNYETYRSPFLAISCGDSTDTFLPEDEDSNFKEVDWSTQLDGQTGKLPVSVTMRMTYNTVLSIEVVCECTPEHYINWQIETYGKIVEAHDRLVAEQRERLASQQRQSLSVQVGMSPSRKRLVEKEELKRGCLQLFTGQHFIEFDATRANVPVYGYPEFDIDEAVAEGFYSTFFEQAFEWENMTYTFYPYFWGRKDKWIENSTVSDPDTVFDAFLRAGSARIVVPVRPRFENAIGYFSEFGGVWNGEAPPVPGDDLYISIALEAAEDETDLPEPEPHGEAWTYLAPTELVMLQQGDKLPEWPAGESEGT